MNELKGLSQQEVQERIEQGQVNYTGQSISKTKKEIVKQHTLTYFNFLKWSRSSPSGFTRHTSCGKAFIYAPDTSPICMRRPT